MKIWANSGDSHYMEPADLYSALPPALAERMPRSVKSPDGTKETIYVDGSSFERDLPRLGIVKGKNGRTLAEALRAPGDHDFGIRRGDLDDEGIWAEVIYPSVGLWNSMITDPALAREAVKVSRSATSRPLRSPRSTSTTRWQRSAGPPGWASRRSACPVAPRRESPTSTGTTGTRCGMPRKRRGWCSPSTPVHRSVRTRSTTTDPAPGP